MDESRTPPLTSLRGCEEIRLTDGMGTQGQAGCTQPTDGHCTTATQRTQGQAGAAAPVAGSLPLAVNLGTGRGILASVRLSPVRGANGRLYGGTEAAWRPGCKDERI